MLALSRREAVKQFLLASVFHRAAFADYRVRPGTICSPDGDAIVVKNGRRFGNRPLYCSGRPSVALAGDRPVIRYLDKPHAGGALLVAVARRGRAIWLHDYSAISASYRAGRMTWRLSDPRVPGLAAVVEAVPLADRAGYILSVSCKGLISGDRLHLLYGGLLGFSDDNLFWRADPGLHPSVQSTEQPTFQGNEPVPHLNDLDSPFHESMAYDNKITVDGQSFEVERQVTNKAFRVRGVCTAPARISVRDGSRWKEPLVLAASRPAQFPVVSIEASLREDTPFLLAIETAEQRHTALRDSELANALSDARRKADALASFVTVRTPDAEFNASVPALMAAADAIYYPPKIVSGAMSWNTPYIGWRVAYGLTCLGWSDRVKAMGLHYLSTQVLFSPWTHARPDSKRRLSLQDTESRFYGVGRISEDQHFYNMQEVFFDQLVHLLEWTGDAELERALLPALNRHLDWMRDCFDPDGDGLYESYLNVWASDSVWYNGCGTAQSTAYAYRAHRAAAMLEARAGNPASASAHQKRADLISEAVRNRLWIPERGHVAEYREADGDERLHPDACLYSIFLPIDAGLISGRAAVQQLDYTEWGLERVSQPGGGEQCATSNFVPRVWSVRQVDTADTLHLALAYYQAGLGQRAWSLVEGAFKTGMYRSATPGSILAEPPGQTYSSCDFADPVSMYGRVIVEGIYGFKPNRLLGTVEFAPQLPVAWPRAEIRTADFSMTFERSLTSERYHFVLTAPAAMRVRLPVRSNKCELRFTSLDSVIWHAEEGYGSPTIVVETPTCADFILEVPYDPGFAGRDYAFATIDKEAFALTADGGRIVEIYDPRREFARVTLNELGVLKAQRCSHSVNRALLIARVSGGASSWLQLFKLTSSTDSPVPVEHVSGPWRPIDITSRLNGDLRTMYAQRYLSPRPKTTSVQIGDDGYSAWTYSFWGLKPPELNLDAVSAQMATGDVIVSEDGARFRLGVEQRNIAFTSRWQNWPTQIVLPINEAGERIAFLLAGSTHQMQTGIDNGELIIRYDNGIADRVGIHHPGNFWSVTGQYDYKRDAFALPQVPPKVFMLGRDTRAIIISAALRDGLTIENVTLRTLSREVIIGIMAVSIA